MNDMRNYSKQFIQEFNEMYRELPCLWKVKSKEYSNRDLRRKAYEKLIAKLKEIEPDANKDLVKTLLSSNKLAITMKTAAFFLCNMWEK